VVKGGGSVSVFHFSLGAPPDSPNATLSWFPWQQKGCSAIICGGDDSPDSNCLADDVIAAAKQFGITVVGVSAKSSGGVDASGSFYECGDDPSKRHPGISIVT
jgi:hypothetical protein